MKFSMRLAELRLEKKLTQQQLADLMKIGRPTIAGYEVKDKQPDYDKLIWLADFFDVSLDYLLGRTNLKKASSQLILSDYQKEILNLFDSLSNDEKQKAIEMLKIFASMVPSTVETLPIKKGSA